MMLSNFKILISLILLGLLIGCTDWNIDPQDIETPDPVTVSITAVTDTSVTIKWTESLDSKFLSYTVYYNKVSPVDTTAANCVDTIYLKQDTHKTINGLTPKTPYFFRVGVNSTLGSASFSEEVDTTTFESIADKKLILDEVDSTDDVHETSVHLKWTKNWDDGFGKGNYVIYYNLTNSVDTNSILFDTVDTDTITVNSLLRDTTYYFKVYQLRNGVPSAGSNIVSAKTTKGEPQAIKVNTKKAGNNSITLSWSPSTELDFNRYFVVMDVNTAVDTFSRYDSTKSNVYVVDSNLTTITIDSIFGSPLEMNQLYWFSVYVEDTSLLVTPTAPDSITTDDGIADPVEISIGSVTNTSVVLNWTKNSDADFSKYLIYMGTTDSVTDGDSLIDSISNKETTSYPITGLDSLTKYWFKVYVKSTYGIATSSNEVVNFPVILTSQAVEMEVDSITDPVNHDTSYTVNLIWQGGDDYHNDSFKKYVVYRSNDSFNSILDAKIISEITEIGTYTYADSTIVKGNEYHYRIYHQSLDGDGYLVEQFSNEIIIDVN